MAKMRTVDYGLDLMIIRLTFQRYRLVRRPERYFRAAKIISALAYRFQWRGAVIPSSSCRMCPSNPAGSAALASGLRHQCDMG